MKRSRPMSSSEDSDDGSNATSWSLRSRSPFRGSSWSRSKGRKPSEVFRTDLITAMMLHDSCQLGREEYYVLADPWRQEWEKGVQVPVCPQSIPRPTVRTLAERGQAVTFTRPKKLIRMPGSEPPVLGYVDICTLADSTCRYDLDETDAAWLDIANQELRQMGMKTLDEITMERVLEEFERRCYDSLAHAMQTEEGLGIEYDEDVVCDVCLSPHGEDGNEMVFCDKCNICVHQACYGILNVPEGSWLCRICALGVLPKCLLCPKKGGAMKPTRSATKWVHVSCALWIPEVSIGNPEKMEPIMNISRIPSNRWALECCLCKEKSGACIQCSAKSCRTAFHVTCALDRRLQMNTILTETDEVKFKSFCPQHSAQEGGGEGGRPRGVASPRRSPTPPPSAAPGDGQQEATEQSQRKLKLQQLNDLFFAPVSVADVARHLQLPEDTVDFLFQYWKLRRRANFNRPLLTPRRDEEDDLAKREQDVLLRRLKLFTHLRQDLERVRNLTYMVTRREKIKRSMCRVHEQIFHHHVRMLEEERLSGVSSSACLEDALFFSWVSSLVSRSRRPRGERGSRRREWRRRAADPGGPRIPPPHAGADGRAPEGRRTVPTPPKSADLRTPEAGLKMREAGPQRGEAWSRVEEAGPRVEEAGPRVEEGPAVARAEPECLKKRRRRRGGGVQVGGEERRSRLRERAPPKAKPSQPSLSPAKTNPRTPSPAPANQPAEKRGGVAGLEREGQGLHEKGALGAQLCAVGAPYPRVSLERLPRWNGALVRAGYGLNVSAAPPARPVTPPPSSRPAPGPPATPPSRGPAAGNAKTCPATPPSRAPAAGNAKTCSATPPSRPPAAGNAKNWGSFRIPKKSERLLRAPPPVAQGDTKGKKCHAQPRRGHAPITRRYGADFLQPGILAS